MKQLHTTLFLFGLSASLGALMAVTSRPAAADGPEASQLARSLGAGNNAAFPALNLQINQPSGLVGLNALGQITVPVASDVGAAQVTAVAPGGTMAVPLRLRNSDRLSVRDYAPDGVVGGAYSATALAPQAIGDRIIQMMPAANIQVSRAISADGLPSGTVITGVGPQANISVTASTSDQTIPDSQQSLLINQHGMATALVFAAPQHIPTGTSVSGVGIATGTIVVGLSTDSTTVYISHAVTRGVPVGTPITFTYSSISVHLSNGWTSAPVAGTPIGLYTQDDYAAFSNAAFWNDPGVGGKGARIYVPSGLYYLSKPVATQNNTSFELGPHVSFIPGSASIDAMDGTFPTYSQSSLLSTGYGQSPVVLNIAQTYTQPNVPATQEQAFLIAQQDACDNDGGSWGCGIVGQEIKQAANPSVRRGAFWALHSTDYILPGQAISWAGAELEVANSSGFWGAWTGNSLQGNRIGLHIDNIVPTDPSHVANSYALDPAGDWHTMAMCEGSILDWCFAHSAGYASNQQTMIDSGIDTKGQVFGRRFIAMHLGPDTSSGTKNGTVAAATNTAAINGDGTIGAVSVNTPSLVNQTAGVASIAIEDGGRFNGPVTLVVGAPPQGGTQATVHVSSYTLRAVQGAAAINADYANGNNAPAGVAAGTVFELPGGICTTRPQVTYDGKEFIVSRPGLCTVLPDDGIHALPSGMIRAQLQLIYISGTAGAPATSPVIEPLYGIASVQVDGAGSGYNAGVPPDVFGETSFKASTGLWTGIIYTPIHLTAVMGAPSAAPIRLGSSLTLATLPSGCTAGQFAFVSDARNIGEAAGAGTGAIAYCTTTGKWLANGTAIQN